MEAYGVLSLKEKLGVEVLGMKMELELNWYDGQIGAMPVFSEHKDALAYVDNDESRVFTLEIKKG